MDFAHTKSVPFLQRLRRNFAASLRFRVLVLTIAIFAAIAVPAAIGFLWIVDSTVMKLGTLFAEKQVLYDRARGMETLQREVALAETLARSPIVMEWARDESDPVKRQRGLDELEHFRTAFRDGSYFFVVNGSGNYYFNDAAARHTSDQLRYAVSADNPRDAWYFKTVASGPGCHLNVDHDEKIGATKVWINCVIQDGGTVLGILGSGIDLSTFIRDVVNSGQVGVDSMFVDRSGAVQATRDASGIDFHSLTKDAASRKTVFQLMDTGDAAQLRAMMDAVSRTSDGVRTQRLTVNGQSALVGVGYLDQLGWYNVTVMDVGRMIDRRLFLPIAGLIAAIMVAAAALVTYLFKRSVLDRLARAEASVRSVENGEFHIGDADGRRDEIGRLARALASMAQSVKHNTETLEAAVEARTDQLRRIAFLDPLTGALNRRGFGDAFAARTDDGRRSSCGLLVMDVDRFKAINDARGHQAGDEVIIEVARRLRAVLGSQDVCARWGGDEFMVMLKDADADALIRVSSAIMSALRSRPIELSNGARLRITTSIGAHVVAGEETLEAAAHRADLALYAAKRSGRNRAVIYDAKLHGETLSAPRVA